MKKQNLIGKKFGKLTVIKESENKGKNIAWICKCDCGKEKTVLAYNLTAGKSKSCGCERIKTLKRVMTKHGGGGTRLYSIFKGMSQRCYNKNNPAYCYYGGKGIKICDEWRNDFESFRNWSQLNGYSETMSIDRINPNGGYEPNNCRWVTMKVQQNNKLNSAFLIIDEEKHTIAEWAEKNNTNKQTLYSKIYRLFEQLNINEKTLAEIEIKTNGGKIKY